MAFQGLPLRPGALPAADLLWVETHADPSAQTLKEALEAHGYRFGKDGTTAILVVPRPDPYLLPPQATEALWWVKEAMPEEVSKVLALRSGWVLRNTQRPELALEVVQRLRKRDLGSEGWLRKMLHQASLEELLRLTLVRAMDRSGAAGGAVWVRHGDMYFQRVGDASFPQAPVSLEMAEVWAKEGRAAFLVPEERLGLIALRGAFVPLSQVMADLKDVEALLISAWRLEESRLLSFQDDLTVAQNRRALEAELPRFVRESAAKRESLVLLFLDVDNLKAVNSAYGHPAGSHMLQAVADRAKRLIRAHDRLYRYGGDEFCILMPGTHAEGAVKLGERLIRVLAEDPMPLPEGRIPISLSIGLAAFPAHADGAEGLLARADQALLEAKRSGKGRVVVAS